MVKGVKFASEKLAIFCPRSQTVSKISLNCSDADADADEKGLRKILAVPRSFFGCVADVFLPLSNFKSMEKLFLQKLCDIEAKVLEPVCGKCDDGSKDLIEKSKARALSSLRKIIEVGLFPDKVFPQMFKYFGHPLAGIKFSGSPKDTYKKNSWSLFKL